VCRLYSLKVAVTRCGCCGRWRVLQYEMRANLNKFEGSSSISSDELFGSGPNRSSSSSSSSFTRTDLSDIREGVRQGVTKVAGRLSNFASGVMSSVQVCFFRHLVVSCLSCLACSLLANVNFLTFHWCCCSQVVDVYNY